MKRIVWIAVIFWTISVYNPNANAVGVGVTAEVAPETIAPGSPAGLFYDALRPYGEWVWIEPYGFCWYPYSVPIDWQPYTYGQWIYSDYGWTWFSDYPWGWACFHYGTWDYDDYYGWLWCPGTIWSPAWVVWRCNDNWIGWAPCSSRLRWRAGFGFELGGIDIDDVIPRNRFCFVDVDHFTDENLRQRILPFARSVTAFNATKTSVNLNIEGDRIVNTLPVQNTLEKRLGHPIQQTKLVDSDTISYRKPLGKENQIPVFKPDAKQLASKHSQIVESMTKESKASTKESTASPDLTKRQAEQSKALQQQQTERAKQLENTHQQEMQNIPKETTKEQLQKQQEQERAALEEQAKREQQILQNQHQYERNASPPKQRQQRYMIPNQPIRPTAPPPQIENRGQSGATREGRRGRQ